MTNETNFDAIDLSGAVPAKEPERQYYLSLIHICRSYRA